MTCVYVKCKINQLLAQTKTDWWIVSVCFGWQMTTRPQVYIEIFSSSTSLYCLSLPQCCVPPRANSHLSPNPPSSQDSFQIFTLYILPSRDSGHWARIWSDLVSPLYSVLTSVSSYWSAARPPIGRPLKLSSDWLRLGIRTADWLNTCTLCHWLVCC